MLSLLVRGTLFWCSGSWNLTNKQLSNLIGAQGRMLRRMLCRRKPENQSLGDFVHDSSAIIQSLRAKHEVRTWDLEALRNHFGWGGYVSRLKSEDPTRLTHRVLAYRDAGWLKLTGDQNYGRQLHCRKLRVWRWEQPLKKWGANNGSYDWHVLAADKRSWLTRLDEAATWYRHHR